MSKFLRENYENVRLTPGKGRGSAALSIGFGAISFLGALCFLFPFVLTTPEVRASYNTD